MRDFAAMQSANTDMFLMVEEVGQEMTDMSDWFRGSGGEIWLPDE